ncbi:Alpha-factor-transporting ATPase [Fulvia fulva]|uniref:Alpha-factor-transporting ATPase n=1 Tax=Passalora fulva TaxID=5499 RepID=A0A9Q8P4P5_PASFU|nr:Alpha-factor-transporting ATPase [Fulvia fulva]KAK4635206.1 Alpha-factor-transporting ATPase [Fulvia fulva]KAK4637291.1 Alpha-factor-transporting ATPase [Fulvia fulva]UJO12947.1 Alpha-factor-transporting ATPase [Fulvia fulva]WPV08644.1 Alpha-factor-transporting ATPase [Fulvia fulva]WPV23886.1 Alpha-factor-transporting ATPase [Fulvia fulva]
MAGDKRGSRSSQDNSSNDSREGKVEEKDEDGEKVPDAPWRCLFAFTTRANIPLLVAGIFCSFAAGFMGPAVNFVVGKVVGGLTNYQSGSMDGDKFLREQTKWVLWTVAISAGSWIFGALEFLLWMSFGELQAKSARDRLFHGLLGREVEWYERRKNGIGALLPRLQAQIRELQLATSQPLGSIFALISTCVLSLAQALYRSWDLALVTLATVPVIIFALVMARGGLEHNITMQQDKLTEAQKYSTSAFSSIETVKCFNGQEIELKKYNTCIDEAGVWYAWVANASALQMGLAVLLSVSMFVQGFYYGGILVGRGTIQVDDVVTTFFSAIGAFQALQGILPQMIVFEKGRKAGSVLRTIMAQVEDESTIEHKQNLLAPATCRGDIEVLDLSFAYPSRPDILAIQDVSMVIPGGQMTFLIGRSGSGKSTISQLLMRFYTATGGTINIDNIPLASLDTTWLRSNITLVEQTSLLFNDTVLRNIAFGRGKDYEQVTREEVVEAAEFALLQLMISDMPDGLDTGVGFKGGSMSGGQRQRMALARARIRDSPILILDESTSALDYITRTLMMEAIRRWRTGKTTIIITHDISQIMADDYIYLLESGRLVQEGYRSTLEKMKGTPFQGFLSEGQRAAITSFHNEGYESVTSIRTRGSSIDSDAFITKGFEDELDPIEKQLTLHEKRATQRISYFPTVLDGGSPLIGLPAYRPGGPTSNFASPFMRMNELLESPNDASPSHLRSPADHPTSLTPTQTPPPSGKRWSQVLERFVDQTGKLAAEARQHVGTARLRRPLPGDPEAIPLRGPEEALAKLESDQNDVKPVRYNSLKTIFGTLWPSLDRRARFYLILGFWGATVHAVGSPLFSFVLVKLLATYQVPGGDKAAALKWSMAILGIAFADAAHTWTLRFFHEYTGQLWVDSIRAEAYSRILDQPKHFFEKDENGVSKLTESLDRNAEEMRNLLGRFASLAYVAVLMVIVTITWAAASSWKLTLIALAVSPYIYGVTKLFARISEKWESNCNDAAADASAIFTETFTNIKTVRALTLESHFTTKYRTATVHALKVGFKRAMYTGFFFGLSDSAGNFATSMIFYVGARLVTDGASPIKVIEVFTMLIMAITNVSAILEYIPQMGSSKDTASRLLQLARLPKDSHEHRGDTRITTVGEIVFDDLKFAYPSRPNQTILQHINLKLLPGTTTAIVGGSGSGKSTIANLLLDLYSTSTVPGARPGDLTFGGRPMQHIHTPSLRALIVSVSQTPTLFSATAFENIAYGIPADSPNRSQQSIETAARQAGIHDFLASLPQGYETPIGEGGLGLSGGQAQRVNIARALVRKPSVLILDEATSALDVESANLVRSTIHNLISDSSHEMTVVIITHHRDMMEIAERIVVLDQGGIAEVGTFKELLQNDGALANLLGGGEWRDVDAGQNGVVSARKESAKVLDSGGPKLKDVDWMTSGGRESKRRPEAGDPRAPRTPR